MDIRIRAFFLLAMTAVIAAIWTFPSWFPLLNPQTVTEAYPGLPIEVQAEYLLLPATVRQAYEALRDGDEDDEIPPRPGLALALVSARLLMEDQVVPDEDQAFTPPSQTIIRTGTFREIDLIRRAQGTVSIYQTNDLRQVLRLEEFQCTRAPNIHLVLTRNPDPLDERSVGIDYIDLGPLKGNVGPQTFDVPAGVDFRIYPILALYLPDHDFVISTATLR